MPEAQRAGKTPFIYTTDADKQLVRIGVSGTIIALVEERRRNWKMLQYLDGQHVSKLSAEYAEGVAALQAQVREALKQREDSLDGIARAMSDLATSSQAPAGGVGSAFIPLKPVAASGSAPTVGDEGNGEHGSPDALVTLEDSALCTNCKTCYQDVPEIFEKTRLLVDGESREAARIIPGILARVQPTPELKARIKRVAANCDAEIIHG